MQVLAVGKLWTLDSGHRLKLCIGWLLRTVYIKYYVPFVILFHLLPIVVPHSVSKSHDRTFPGFKIEYKDVSHYPGQLRRACGCHHQLRMI